MFFLSEYDPSTGLFTGVVLGAVLLENLITKPEASYLAGSWNAHLYKVDTSSHTVIEPTPEQLAAYEAGPPTPVSRWNIVTMAWEDFRSELVKLAEAKTARITAIKTEAVSRMPAVFAPLALDAELFAVFRELWLSIASAARVPTPNLTTAINVYQAAATAIGQVRAATTVAEVAAVTVNWPA